EVMAHVDADHHSAHAGERPRHVDDPELPAAITGDEDRSALWPALGDVYRDGAEAAGGKGTRIAIVYGGGGGPRGARRPPRGRGRGGGRRGGEGAGGQGQEGAQAHQGGAAEPRATWAAARAARVACRGGQQAHRANNSLTPPAISTDTSTNTRGRAIPPGATK